MFSKTLNTGESPRSCAYQRLYSGLNKVHPFPGALPEDGSSIAAELVLNILLVAFNCFPAKTQLLGNFARPKTHADQLKNMKLTISYLIDQASYIRARKKLSAR